MNAHLDAVVRSHDRTAPAGLTSVCSAHPLVIEAALRQGRADGPPVLIEATSNQVDQFGGYTGLRPADFRRLVEDIADRVGFPLEDLVLGGDHLGPHRWRDRADSETRDGPRRGPGPRPTSPPATPSSTSTAATPCADDGEVLDGEVMAGRAARMLAAAEAEAARVGLTGALRYVIGTEVPVPGGADHEITRLVPTSVDVGPRDPRPAPRRRSERSGSPESGRR